MPRIFPEYELSTFIAGHPRPQGSKVADRNGRMWESSKQLPVWRRAVTDGLLGKVRDRTGATWLQPPLFAGPIHMELEFVMPRPVALKQKPTPPATKRPDLDKLTRAVFDAAQAAGMFLDDSNVIEVLARKRVAEFGEQSGLHIQILQVERDDPDWSCPRTAGLRRIRL